MPRRREFVLFAVRPGGRRPNKIVNFLTRIEYLTAVSSLKHIYVSYIDTTVFRRPFIRVSVCVLNFIFFFPPRYILPRVRDMRNRLKFSSAEPKRNFRMVTPGSAEI